MAAIMRIGVIVACVVILLSDVAGGDLCPAYCDVDRLYVASSDCPRGYCCGTHSSMYCCVSYFDRVPTPYPNVTSSADCVVPDSGAASVVIEHVTLSLPIILTLLGRTL